MNGTLFRLLFSALIAASVVGCVPGTPGKPGAGGASGASRPISLISPMEFFPPEQKRLSQHLNWHTGCFKIEYSGPEARLKSRLELWVDGKLDQHSSGTSGAQAGMSEVSIAVRDEGGNSRNFQVSEYLTTEGGAAGGTSSYTKPNLGSWSTAVSKIQGPQELRKGEEVVVWAIMLTKSEAGRTISNQPGEPILDQVKRSNWALVLKITLDPPEK